MSADPARGVAVFAPTPLVTVTVECSAAGDEQLHLHVGGQGVWVARMIAHLGVPVTLCAALGGETGQVARTLLGGQGIELVETQTVAWNGGYVHDRRSGERRELADVAPGPLLRHELDDLYSSTLAAAFGAGVCVLTGTQLHPVVPDATYRRLAHDLHSNGVDVVADLSGAQLAAALEGGVTMVKVSEEELGRDGRLSEAGATGSVSSDADLERALGALCRDGADNAVISCSERPTRALVGGVHYDVSVPLMEPVDHRGAGDAMTGVLAWAYARRLPADELLRTAAAAGAATVVRHGYATGTRGAIDALARAVVVNAHRHG